MSQHKNQKISCPQVKLRNSYDIGFCEDAVAGKLNAEFRNLLHSEKVQQSDVIISCCHIKAIGYGKDAPKLEATTCNYPHLGNLSRFLSTVQLNEVQVILQ